MIEVGVILKRDADDSNWWTLTVRVPGEQDKQQRMRTPEVRRDVESVLAIPEPDDGSDVRITIGKATIIGPVDLLRRVKEYLVKFVWVWRDDPQSLEWRKAIQRGGVHKALRLSPVGNTFERWRAELMTGNRVVKSAEVPAADLRDDIEAIWSAEPPAKFTDGSSPREYQWARLGPCEVKLSRGGWDDLLVYLEPYREILAGRTPSREILERASAVGTDTEPDRCVAARITSPPKLSALVNDKLVGEPVWLIGDATVKVWSVFYPKPKNSEHSG